MGGHGGINILGQKRWHVYRFDNQRRVERDEQRREEQERTHAQRERQQRMDRNIEELERRQQQGAVPHAMAALEASQQQQGAAPHAISEVRQQRQYDATSTGTYPRATIQTRQQQQHRVANKALFGDKQKGEHINFFKEEERVLMAHEEEEKRRIAHQKLNNALAGKAKDRPLSEFTEAARNVPWYARPRDAPTQLLPTHRPTSQKASSSVDIAMDSRDAARGSERKHRGAKKRKRSLGSGSDSSTSSDESRKKKEKKKKSKKQKKRKKKKDQGDMLELRRRRDEREKSERWRAQDALLRQQGEKN